MRLDNDVETAGADEAATIDQRFDVSLGSISARTEGGNEGSKWRCPGKGKGARGGVCVWRFINLLLMDCGL